MSSLPFRLGTPEGQEISRDRVAATDGIVLVVDGVPAARGRAAGVADGSE